MKATENGVLQVATENGVLQVTTAARNQTA
jgi:hypothetical protein